MPWDHAALVEPVWSDAGWLFSNEGSGWVVPAFRAVAMVVQSLPGDGLHAVKPTTFFRSLRDQNRALPRQAVGAWFAVTVQCRM